MSLSASTSSSLRSSRMRGSSISTPKFPFPEDAFASARLSTEQLHAHEQQIQELIAQALDECDRADVMGRAAYTDSWEVVGFQDNITALRREEPASNTATASSSSSSHKSQYRLIGDVGGDYRDLMALYYADTSNDLYEWLQFMNQSTLDAQIIQTVESATAEKPHQYFGVKWTVFQLSKLATKMNQCFVEYMTYCKDSRGRDVGVRVTLPIRIPEIDLTMEAMKVRRMASQMVQIFRRVDDKTTRTFVMLENDFLTAAPAAYAKTLLTLSHDVAMSMDARRIRRRGVVAERHWTPNASRRSCVVCTRTFGATRGRHHCRLCGDVICRKCTVMRDTADPVTRKTFKVVKTKFCVVCIVNLRARDEADAAGASASAAAQPIAAVDLSASMVSAVVQASSSTKGRGMDYVVNDSVDEGSRSSVWSETESEGCTGDFDFSDSARTSLSSSFSDVQEGGSEKHSFGKRLHEIAERVEELAVDEGSTAFAATSGSGTGSRKSRPTDLVLFIPDDSEYIETIDTKDMIRGHQIESPLSASGVFTLAEFKKKRNRTDSANQLNGPSSTRSLDQNLAEQEALLRQMITASQGVVTPIHGDYDDSNYTYEYDA